MKKLLAVSIAATLSNFAFATAHADSNPKFYGQLHASVDVFNGDETNTDDTTVSSNSSRLGVKGSRDLDGDLKAVYQTEFGVNTGGGQPGLASINEPNRLML